MNHRIVPVTDLPLAPVDVAAVATLTAHGHIVRACTCGLYWPGDSPMAVHRMWRLHLIKVMKELADG